MTPLDRERWRVLSPLLDQALDLEPEELPRWLRVCEPSLAEELKSLLAVREAMHREGFLEATPFPTVPPLGRIVRRWSGRSRS